MIKTFTDRNEWLAAVKAAGLVIRDDPPSHEGMHEDDMYEPEWAITPPKMVNDDGERYESFEERGVGSWSENEAGPYWVGYLGDTTDEWTKYIVQMMHEESEGEHHGA